MLNRRQHQTLVPVALIAMLVSVGPVVGQGRRTGPAEDFARTFKVGANPSVTVRNVSGRVDITAGAGDQVEIKAVKRAGASPDSARRLANTVIDARAIGNRIEVTVEAADRRQNGPVSVEFDIRVPSECSVDVGSVSGEIRVTNVKGELRAQAVSGGVQLDSTPKIALAKTVSGDIRIVNGGGSASTAVGTVSGSFTARDFAARDVDIDTVSGAFNISGWSGERLSFRSVSGGLTVSGALARGGRYDLQSHSGNIRLALPAEPGFEVDASTF